jgi:tyrosyl-tRNA synthetase
MAPQNKLSQELTWRGFVNQTTYKDASALDAAPITFYWGVDPSADSMTVGNLAIAMMVRHFIDHGHKAILLVGGATGLIGDPDGKAQERDLLTPEQIAQNKAAISEQYRRIFAGQDFEIVDNYDWFQGMNYLDFLRTVGKHVPVRQMLGRDFVQSRLGEQGAGISYAEFSYSLIQGYDFLHLYQDKGVTLQVCGADQWGNCIAGVDLIRRVTGGEAHIWSAPLVVNKSTGVKFGKSEAGAVWLDPAKTSPHDFYQFWINVDDAGVEDYLKIYTLLDADEILQVMDEFNANKSGRAAQKRLAREVTRLVHGEESAEAAEQYAAELRDTTTTTTTLSEDRVITVGPNSNVIDALVTAGLVSSKSEARQLLSDGGVYINDQQVSSDTFAVEDFRDGQLVLRKGKKLQNSVVVRLQP